MNWRSGSFLFKLSFLRQIMCFIRPFLIFLLFFSFSLVFHREAFADRDVEGSFRLRALYPWTDQDPSSLIWQGRFHVLGEFYPGNDLKAQVHFLSANPSYPLKNSAPEDFFAIYPSFNWLIGQDLELRLGRHKYDSPFHQIISSNDYQAFFYTFDGLFLEYSTQVLRVNFWGASLPKRWNGEERVQDFKYGFGFFLDIESVSDFIDHFNVYVAYLGDSFIDNSSSKMSRYGLSFSGVILPVQMDYTFVVAGHGPGIEFNLKENMYHFSISYSSSDFFNSQIFFGFHTDSLEYNPWLYDQHKNAGFLDMLLWGNLTYYFVEWNSSLSHLFDIQIAFYDIRPTQKGPLKSGYFSQSKTGLKDNLLFAHGKEEAFWRELDLKVKKQLKENIELNFLTGLFFPYIPSQKPWDIENFLSLIQVTGVYKF